MVTCNNKKAFTLAEVLITLLIIGVVSSLVIPALINDTQEQQYKTAFKKKYSVLDQGVKSVMNDNGGTFEGLCANSIEGRSLSCELKLLSKYVHFVKVCDYGSCDISYGMNYIKQLNGVPMQYAYNALAITVDGSIIGGRGYGAGLCSHTNNSCGTIYVDVNGTKPPNTWGKDIYGLYILKNRIIPFGASGDYYTNCDSKSTEQYICGYGCAAKALYQ